MASSPASGRTTLSEEKPLKLGVGIGSGNHSEFGSDEDSIDDACFKERLSPEVAEEILRKVDYYYSLSSHDYDTTIVWSEGGATSRSVFTA